MQGRVIKTTESFKTFNFVEAAKKELSAEMRIRLLALAQVQEGKKCSEVAKIFKVYQKTVRNWVQRFNELGQDGLKIRAGRGRKPKLAKEKYPEFTQAVNELQEQRDGGRVRCADIQALIITKFNVVCAQTTVYDLLKNAGMSWISARSKHPKSSDTQQEEFKKNLLKRSKNTCHSEQN